MMVEDVFDGEMAESEHLVLDLCEIGVVVCFLKRVLEGIFEGVKSVPLCDLVGVGSLFAAPTDISDGSADP